MNTVQCTYLHVIYLPKAMIPIADVIPESMNFHASGVAGLSGDIFCVILRNITQCYAMVHNARRYLVILRNIAYCYAVLRNIFRNLCSNTGTRISNVDTAVTGRHTTPPTTVLTIVLTRSVTLISQ